MKAKGFYTTRRRKSKEERCARRTGPDHFFRMLPDRPGDEEALDEDEVREDDEEPEDREELVLRDTLDLEEGPEERDTDPEE